MYLDDWLNKLLPSWLLLTLMWTSAISFNCLSPLTQTPSETPSFLPETRGQNKLSTVWDERNDCGRELKCSSQVSALTSSLRHCELLWYEYYYHTKHQQSKSCFLFLFRYLDEAFILISSAVLLILDRLNLHVLLSLCQRTLQFNLKDISEDITVPMETRWGQTITDLSWIRRQPADTATEWKNACHIMKNGKIILTSLANQIVTDALAAMENKPIAWVCLKVLKQSMNPTITTKCLTPFLSTCGWWNDLLYQRDTTVVWWNH